MTPAIRAAKRAKITYTLHEYSHDPQAASYGTEAAEKLNLPAQQVFKTLVVQIGDRELAVAVVPVSGQLDLKAMAREMQVKKVKMAEASQVEKTTGYVLGGVSPLGQKKVLPTVIDQSAEVFPTIHVSGGKRGLEIELAPGDLVRLTKGRLAMISK
ncbi:Cys-tRNA(Pro) deacylase [Desulfogranum japonicum]|uniref:Cys-tRNA(Pro) deacylase n=1 Tax=Desulfogranum japonicum TaxID=231447 RepID=UPI0004028316|nr:Cys-tRNA(Pro) deacylase [Desulfogranum japonicum]